MSGRDAGGPRRRRSGAFLLALATLALLGAGCDDGTDDARDEVEVVAEGRDWWLGVAPGPALHWERRDAGGTTVTTVSDYEDPPGLDEAHAFLAPSGGGGEVALVAGPVPDVVTGVLLTSDLGASVEAELFELEGLQWYLAEVADTEATLIIEAFDADGAVFDIADLDLRDAESTAPAP